MKLATFNIYWLGNTKFVQMSGQTERTDEDWLQIARVIAKLDADVLAFQEIVSIVELQTVLDLASGMTARSYRLFDADDKLLGEAKFGGQKVVVTYDAQRYGPVAASPISGGGKGLAFGVRLNGVTANGGQVLVVESPITGLLWSRLTSHHLDRSAAQGRWEALLPPILIPTIPNHPEQVA